MATSTARQLAAELSVRKQMSARRVRNIRRRQKPPLMRFPRGIQLEYGRILRDYSNIVASIVRETVYPALEALGSQYIQDHRLDDDSDLIDQMFSGMRESIAESSDLDNQITNIIGKISTWQRKELNGQIKYKLGVDILFHEPWLSGYVDQARRDNVRLITKMTETELSNVEGIMRSGFRSGRRVEDLRKQISHELKVSKSRAYLIARDQTNKINGQLNQKRQTGLGIEKYTWRTSWDDKVRERHAERDGHTYRWDDPPEGGHPGEDVQCRCSGEPVLDHLIDEQAKPFVKGPVPDPKPKPRKQPSKPKSRPKPKRVQLAPERSTKIIGRGLYRKEIPLTERQIAFQRMADTMKSAVNRSIATPEQRNQWQLWEWVHGSNRKTSVLMKDAAQKEFKKLNLTGMVYNPHGLKIDPSAISPMRKDLRHMYKKTQDEFRRRNVKTVTLYRGVTKGEYRNVIESWTADKKIASDFAKKTGGVVVSEEIPVDNILISHKNSHWVDGAWGLQSEYVVLR